MDKGRHVVIVGAGTIGLLCARAITEKNPACRLSIVDRGDRRQTAGMSASAFVDPDWGASQRTDAWLRDSLAFYAHVATNPDAGVVQVPMHVLRRKPRPQLLSGERPLADHELLPGFGFGTAAETFRIDPPVFLRWLRGELPQRQVSFCTQELTSFSQILEQLGHEVLIVNAAGVGARHLAADNKVVPYRGHCVRIHLENAPQEVRLSAGEQTWCVPVGGGECRIGGTSEPDCWALDPDPEAVAAILQRVGMILPTSCGKLEPAQIIETTCGLRPRREGGVRLEHDQFQSVDLIHCYGHGGEGFTLGPGSALEVCKIVKELVG